MQSKAALYIATIYLFVFVFVYVCSLNVVPYRHPCIRYDYSECKVLYSFGITLKRQRAIECWPVGPSEQLFT
jgi:membrane protein YdbS with pleckstrin-like domain